MQPIVRQSGLQLDIDEETGKHGPLTNIFSCWNGMVGTGLVTIPWAYSLSGVLLGIIFTVITFILAFTTQYFIMKTAGVDKDYTETLKKTFGKRGFYFGMCLFIGMLSIPIILYYQLLAQFLYSIILPMVDSHAVITQDSFTTIDFTKFSYSWTCLMIFVLVFIITARKDLTIFIKINTFGVIFTMIIITFIIGVGFYGIYHGGYTYTAYGDTADENFKMQPEEILLFGSRYGPLIGTLGGGFYLHNISLPIYQNSKNREGAVRDMFFGFGVVCLSYIVCGTLGVYGFSSTAVFGDDVDITANQNCLNSFGVSNVMAIFIRVCTFCQILACCSLIFACQRSQILLLATGSQEAKSMNINYMLNVLILIPPGLLAIFYPQVGVLAGILGSLGGLLCIYIMPTVTFLAQKKTEINHPHLVAALRENNFVLSPPGSPRSRGMSEEAPKTPKIGIRPSPQFDDVSDQENVLQMRNDSHNARKTKFTLAVIVGVTIIGYGLFVLYMNLMGIISSLVK